ncbi:MAG: hypothetical protein M9965_11970 [Anaerolineae bacterium]|nr:hypothetical protein [Anaerolineae bacterium]
MNASTRTSLVTIVIAVALVAVALLAITRIYRGDGQLLRDVSVSLDTVTPNADGDSDITPIVYEITRNADVSIYFENEDGDRYYFRQAKPRGVGQYRVLFSGVVDGFTLSGEQIQGEIMARLLPDDTYKWAVEATDEAGHSEVVSGTLTVAEGDTALPEMRDFVIDNTIFTPNRDGIADRTQIQFNLQKEAATRVYLEMPDGAQIDISELPRDVPPDEPGWHIFDYEGGVDFGAQPPPDGTYTIVALAEDAEGQKMRVSDALTIQYGGVPRARILSPVTGDTFELSATAVQLCDTIFFTVTLENYSETPIRTTGPEPGTVYDSDWNYNTLGWHTESGAWRLAVGYENEISNYPYRWAVGTDADLEEIDGYRYLMPGERAVITGGIRMTGPFGVRNPQPVWVGLIHEDVEISQFNNRVDPHSILLDLPDEGNWETCEPRVIPERSDEG